MVPREAVASRVTVWPTWTLLVSAEMVATTWADGSWAPVMTTSPVSTPPRLDVTRTSLGGTGTPVTFQISPPFAAFGTATTPGYPSRVSFAFGSPDWAVTINRR